MIRIFKYLPDVDAFVVTDEYLEIAERLGLCEWHPAVWIGRLFILDNDFGEHWFDNWDLRADRGLKDEHLAIDPDRFRDGKDGPCHSSEFRKRFWTDVLKSLELSLELLFDKAREVNEANRKWFQKYPGEGEVGFEVIADLEDRIVLLRKRFGAE